VRGSEDDEIFFSERTKIKYLAEVGETESAICSADNQYASQSWWADQVQGARKMAALRSGTARDYVRMISQEGPLAHAWLTVTPSANKRTLLSDIDFRSLCRYFLGLPLLQDGTTLRPCPLCREALDPFGDHFVTCAKNGVTRRHNSVRDSWADLLRQSGVPHVKEAPSATNERPADILLLGFSKGIDVALDFTVCSPCTLDQYPLCPERVRKHLAHAEATRRDQNSALCQRMHWECCRPTSV